MEYKDYIKLITDKKVRPVCLMTGEEDYVKKSVIERLKKTFIDESMIEFDMNLFDNDNATVDNILSVISSPAMFSEKRVVIADVRAESPLFKDEKLVKLIDSLSDDVLLVLEVRGKPDRRSSIVKHIEEKADCVLFDKIEKSDLIKWIVREFKNYGKQISNADAEYLLTLVGEDLFALQSEVAKLSDCTEEKTVSHADVETMIAHTPEHGVFTLVDAVAAKKPKDAMKQTKLLFNDGSEAFQLLALLERQYQLILRYIGMMSNGYQQKEIMDRLGLKPYPFELLRKQAGKYTAESCKKALQMCLDLDFAVKSGKADANTGFEMLIVKLST